MPEQTSSGAKKKVFSSPAPVIKPKVAPKKVEPVQKTESKIILESKPHRRWLPALIITIIAVIIIGGIGAAAYFFMNSTSSDNQETENIVIDDTEQIPPEEQNPGVTTDSEWLEQYFGAPVCTEIAVCGDRSDPDRDGLNNLAEFQQNTGPNDPDSDSDGIADGDELNIFGTDPLVGRTYRDDSYTDQDFIKNGYDITTNQPYTPQRLAEVKAAVKQFGLHQPTLLTLGSLSFELYDFEDPEGGPRLPDDLDLSPEAKLDRDSQRQSTIKKIGAALLAYKEDKGEFPPTDNFIIMSDMVRPYNTLATNYNDPISIDPYNYGYETQNNNQSFTLLYYSETQDQLIKYTDVKALEEAEEEDSKAFDDQRIEDIEAIANALRVYSSVQLDTDSVVTNIFPHIENYEADLVPRYITKLPVDPETGENYEYSVGPTKETFTIRAILKNPVAGATGYECDENSCQPY